MHNLNSLQDVIKERAEDEKEAYAKAKQINEEIESEDDINSFSEQSGDDSAYTSSVPILSSTTTYKTAEYGMVSFVSLQPSFTNC